MFLETIARKSSWFSPCERALRRFARCNDNHNTGFVVFDELGNIHYSNPGVAESAYSLISEGSITSTETEGIESVLNESNDFSGFINARNNETVFLATTDEQGEERHLDVTVYQRNFGKKKLYVMETHDVTDHITRTNGLAVEHELFRQLFDHTSNGIVIYDSIDNGDDFVIKYVNSACCEIEGVELENLVGKRVTEAFPNVNKESFGLLDVMKRVYNTGEAEQTGITYYEDETREGYRSNYVVKLPNGEIACIYRDETEHMDAMKLHKEKALTDASAFLVDKLANMAMGIGGYLLLLQDEPGNKEFLEELGKANKNLTRMVDKLNWSVGYKPREETCITVNEIYNIIREKADNYQHEINVGINTEFNNSQNNTYLNIGNDTLDFVVDEIILNSVEAEANKVDITTKYYQSETDEKTYMHISFSDNGVGMTTEELEKACDQFYSGKRVNKGTKAKGLGLSAVKGLIEMSGGKIELDSDGENQGATINLYLPLAEEHIISYENSR